jgi:general stress protein 26|tara:strand:+ start:3451 stop:3585 length:135 start_codon:yes stop_codon:yes gene_type:complete
MIQEIKSEYQKLLELVKEKELIEKQWNEAIKKFYESKINENEKE